jgi:hypothetical protein
MAETTPKRKQLGDCDESIDDYQTLPFPKYNI